MQNTLDIVALCSPENTFRYVSPSVERVLGYQPEELIGTVISDLVHPEDLEAYGNAMIEELESVSGPFGPIEARYRHKDGSWRHLEVTINSLVDDPEVRGIVCVGRDVTERRELAEEVSRLNETLEGRVAMRTAQLEAVVGKLSESEGRYRAVIEQAAEGILLVDVDSKRVLEASAAYQGMLGYGPEEVSGLTLYDLVPYSREAMDCYVGRVREGGSYVSGERRHRRKDGSLIDVEVRANVISYGGKEALCVVVRDITERKRAEKALLEVREGERKRMARDLHDGALQDLTYALAEAQVMRVLNHDSELDKRLDDQIEALRNTERRLRAAVYDLRLGEEGGRSLAELLETLVEESGRMFSGCEVRLVVEDGLPQAPPGEAGVEVLRILREALSNVRRHSNAGRVLVAVRGEGTDVVAEVSDDGRGFVPGGASGVGLKSMRERAGALGGEFEVASEPGVGTRVRLRVPTNRLG